MMGSGASNRMRPGPGVGRGQTTSAASRRLCTFTRVFTIASGRGLVVLVTRPMWRIKGEA
jgi:hypothetical protein